MHQVLQHCLSIGDKYHNKWVIVADFSAANWRSAMTVLGEIMQVNAGNVLLSLEYYRSNR